MPVWNKFWLQLPSLKPSLGLAAAAAVAVMFWPSVLGPSLAALGADGMAQTGQFLPQPQQAVVIDWSQVPSLNDLQLSSLSVVVVSLPSGRLVGALEPDLVLPIASLTKIMSSVVILESKLSLDSSVKLMAADNSGLTKQYFTPGESISLLKVADGESIKVQNLLAASLIGSANNAVLALARATGLPKEEFVRRMNWRAQILGMTEAEFVDPTGLETDNTATAYDLAILARYAWQNRLLRQLSGTAEVGFTSVRGRAYKIRNTNPLFYRPLAYKLLASKTGYLDESGYNLVVEVRTRQGQRYLLVLLNASTAEERNSDAGTLVNWLEKSS